MLRWDDVANIPLLVPSQGFAAAKLQWEAKAAAVRKDPAAANAALAKLVSLSQEPGQHPFAKLIISLQATEAEAFAAEAADDPETAIASLKEAVAIEDSIEDLSQPPYPVAFFLRCAPVWGIRIDRFTPWGHVQDGKWHSPERGFAQPGAVFSSLLALALVPGLSSVRHLCTIAHGWCAAQTVFGLCKFE